MPPVCLAEDMFTGRRAGRFQPWPRWLRENDLACSLSSWREVGDAVCREPAKSSDLPAPLKERGQVAMGPLLL